MNVRFSRDALAELDEIFSYIGAHSAAGAKRTQQRILAVIEYLKRFPRIGTPTDDAVTRMLVANPYPYLIFYEIDEAATEIIILHIRHGAREREE